MLHSLRHYNEFGKKRIESKKFAHFDRLSTGLSQFGVVLFSSHARDQVALVELFTDQLRSQTNPCFPANPWLSPPTQRLLDGGRQLHQQIVDGFQPQSDQEPDRAIVQPNEAVCTCQRARL